MSWRVICAALLVLVATACSPDTAGQAERAASTGDTSSDGASGGSGAAAPSAEVQEAGAPKVANPLDVRAVKQNPCRLLTAAQTKELFGRVVQGERQAGQLGLKCFFGNKFRPPGVRFAATLPDRTSLEVLYEGRENFAVFQPIEPIGGYPAVIALLDDNRARGQCTLDVGVNDEQSLTILVRVGNEEPNYDSPCGVAEEVAKQVMQTVKGEA